MCLFVRVVAELAIPCTKSGPRVFNGFTVGFHPRSSEVVKFNMINSVGCFFLWVFLNDLSSCNKSAWFLQVYNGLTQLGFEQPHHGFR
jgi:hypothetical protein